MNHRLIKAINILRTLNQPDRVIKRDQIKFTKFMNIIGNPFKSFKSIHVTGTNGKGSVSIKTAKIVENAGYKVGLYTSPHLFTFRQRIQINSQKITSQQISQKIIKIQEISRSANISLSYFQYMTAIGFMHFQQNRCQYVVLQVGLGGRNDTTNIVYPEISVITSIGLDHTDLLGPTLEHIAKQKAGIIKKQRPVVLGPSAENFKSIQSAIKQNNCKVYAISPKIYDCSDFQNQNNAIAIQTIKVLQHQNPDLKISQQNIKQGLVVKQPCRMQLLKSQYLPNKAKDKKIYFDVGHNPQAINKIIQYIQKMNYKKDQIFFVFGTSSGKKFDQSLSKIQIICSQIYLVQAKHFRACKISDLQNFIVNSQNPNKYKCISQGDISITLEYVIEDKNCKVIVICGSFFIMPEARSFFQPSIMQNPEENINLIYQ